MGSSGLALTSLIGLLRRLGSCGIPSASLGPAVVLGVSLSGGLVAVEGLTSS